MMHAENLDDHYMREALKQAKRACDRGEIPVGAVIVHKGQIIARAHNQTEMLHDPTAHAEMIAITQAAEHLAQAGAPLHRGSLEHTAIYVTMEPCPMCAGALVLSKCDKLIYGVRDPKAGACGSLYNIAADERLNHRLEISGGVLAQEAKGLLEGFFRNLRKEKR
jgi:tRNA(adenine34) deaminase